MTAVSTATHTAASLMFFMPSTSVMRPLRTKRNQLATSSPASTPSATSSAARAASTAEHVVVRTRAEERYSFIAERKGVVLVLKKDRALALDVASALHAIEARLLTGH